MIHAALLGCRLMGVAAPSAAQRGRGEPAQAEPEPTAVDEKAGVTAKICRWRNNKTAAVSLRFDESQPSHIEIAAPALNKYGMVGTFLMNPGKDIYKKYKDRWETEVIQSGHELGNHTLHHHGAKNDQEAEYEIGECSKYIWSLFPKKSKILAFRRGGGTTWNIKKPWSYYYEKWRLVQAPNSASVGASPDKAKLWNMRMFQERIKKTINDRDWLSLYWRVIGEENGLGVSRGMFAQQIRFLASKRWYIWYGGIAQIYKYREERRKAKVAVSEVAPRKVKIDVTCGTDPELYDEPLTVLVKLSRRWPAEDIQALDAEGNPILMLRHHDAWNEPMLNVPPVNGSYYIHVVDPWAGKERPKPPPESDRTMKDEATGVEATICKWFGGKRTALCIRFDDSHPSHVTTVIPILRDYGFRATFMINPGNENYRNYKEEWEACARRGDQEFANHTLHHCGAMNDEEVEREIGEVSKYIWSLFPNRSKLVALNTGGGTTWGMTKPFRYFLDKYHVFNVTGSLGMDDSYGNRVAAFRRHLEMNIQREGWCKAHYHYIGKGLSSSEENFRAALDVVKEHEAEVWAAGLADAYKYMQERKAAGLSAGSLGNKKLEIELSCAADSELYDQPLTIQLTLPRGWKAEDVKVVDAAGNEMKTQAAARDGVEVVRFDAPPVGGKFTVSMR